MLEQTEIVGQFSRLTTLGVDDLRRCFVFALALHDTGKFAQSFQNLQPELLHHLQNKKSHKKYVIRHDTLGWLWWKKRGKEIFRKLNLLPATQGSARRQQLEIPIDAWLRAVTGHHGIPPQNNDLRLPMIFLPTILP